MNLQTYIAVHDGTILERCERAHQFDALTADRAYLFLGGRAIPYWTGGSVIVPRRLADNVEHHPNFYDFTGWAALARHRMIVREHVMFLQYDMELVSTTIESDVTKLLEDGPGPVAFTAGHNHAGNYMLMIGGFEDTFRRGMVEVGVDMGVWEDFNEWPTTQGLAWRTEDFYDFMDWFRPLFDVWADEKWAGHLAERTVKAWCMLRSIEPRYLPGVIRHEARDCHGTGALMAGNMEVYEERARVFAS